MSKLTDMYITANMDKFPAESLIYIQKRLSNANQTQENILFTTELKSPKVALILSIFFGGLGIDRFYIGQIGIGIAKLFVNIALWFLLLGWVWQIVDLFLIMKATRKENMNRLMNTLNALHTHQTIHNNRNYF